MINAKKWDLQTLEAKLRALDPWHFLVELCPGVFNVPRERWRGIGHNIVAQDYVARNLLPMLGMLSRQDKANTTILDIGCNEGWLSLVLHRAGYKRIVGIDPNEGNIRRALFLKEYLDMKNVDFYQADVNDFRTQEKFDFSLMLGVMNHTHNPVGILRNIHALTQHYLVLDFDARCQDDTEDNMAARFREDPTSIAGAMSCHFERAHPTTSCEDGNLVFQYSKRTMQFMLNYAGFAPVLHALSGIAAPAHYRDGKRIMLVGKKQSRGSSSTFEVVLGREYAESNDFFDFSQPRLVEEGYKHFNIVCYGRAYYGVPQGELEVFDIMKIIHNEKCCLGSSLQEVKTLLDKYLDGGGRLSEISGTDQLRGDKIKYSVGCELLLQARFEAAKEIFERLLRRHSEPATELTADLFYQLGRMAQKGGDRKTAQKYGEKCLAMDPNHGKAQALLWQLQHQEDDAKSHSIFL